MKTTKAQMAKLRRNVSKVVEQGTENTRTDTEVSTNDRESIKAPNLLQTE